MFGKISHLIPLRDPRAHCEQINDNLADRHKRYHPNEPWLNPVLRSRGKVVEVGYNFYGRFVVAGRVDNPGKSGFVGNLINLPPMRISDVAVLALEQFFGKAGTAEDVFVMAGGTPENRHPGYVFLEKLPDGRDQIKAWWTRKNFSVAVGGSNVVEAGAYFRLICLSLERRLEAGEIEEGVSSVDVEIEGQQEELALVASPLKIKIRLPNPANVSAHDLDRVVEEALNRALSKKRYLHLVT